MKKNLLSLLFLFSLIIGAIAQAETCSFISDKQAVEIAKQYAINEKVRSLDWFSSNPNNYQVIFKDGKWSVFFDGNKTQRIGDHFMIYLTPEGKFEKIIYGR